MSVEIRRGATRFADRGDGVMTWHAFSFGAHYDPERVGYGPMVCHDEHLLANGRGFDTHHHAGLEILTWVLAGSVRHQDSLGGTADLTPGTVGLLSAGSGVDHSEVAVAPATRFVQVWLTAQHPDQPPAYEARTVALDGDGFVTVAQPRADAAFAVARVSGGESVTVPAAPRRHLFVASGALLRSSLAEPLQAGDAFLATDDEHPIGELTVTAAVDSELLLWSFTGPEAGSDQVSVGIAT